MPRLLDLYCCEGGGAVGYQRAGFQVFGVDIVPQPRYPFAFLQGDALAVLGRLTEAEAVPFTHPDGVVEWLTLDDFLVVHASPPCQAYSITRHSHSVQHPDLLAPTRAALIRAGKPYVIENVVGAPMRGPLTLCGSMFGLTAMDTDGHPLILRRHRLFESDIFLMAAGPCNHDPGIMVGGVYGGGPMQRDKSDLRGGYTPARAVRAELMRMDWATGHGLAQAIPPAYTEYIGGQLLAALEAR